MAARAPAGRTAGRGSPREVFSVARAVAAMIRCPPLAMTDTPLPPQLEEIIGFFEMLPDDEKRRALISYADQLPKHAPPEGAEMALVDVRRDQECLDTVGIFLQLDAAERARFFVTVGDEVQTLTRAMAAILCEGLAGMAVRDVPGLPATFVPRIVGQQLFRQRSQTVYYILTRMKAAVKAWETRQRRAALDGAEKEEGEKDGASPGEACDARDAGDVAAMPRARS